MECRWKVDVRKVDRVGAARRHLRDERRIARPQPRIVAGARQVHGKGSPPPACSENRDL